MHTRSYLTDYTPPCGRRPPAETVLRLRAIVPEAELIYMGKGIWSLGTVRHNHLVYQASLRTITKIYKILGLYGDGAFHLDPEGLRELHSRLQTMHLHRQGFRPIAIHQFRGAPDGRIVLDLKEREWRYQTQFETCVRRHEKEAERNHVLEDSIERVKEYFRLEHKSIHRYAFRKARSVISAGVEKAGELKEKATSLITRKAS